MQHVRSLQKLILSLAIACICISACNGAPNVATSDDHRLAAVAGRITGTRGWQPYWNVGMPRPDSMFFLPRPLKGMVISLYEHVGDEMTPGRLFASDTTDENGTYQLQVMPGVYFFAVHAGGWYSQIEQVGERIPGFEELNLVADSTLVRDFHYHERMYE